MRHNIRAMILGIAQDGGVPHPGCNCNTCKFYWDNEIVLSPTSLAIIDEKQFHLIDVTRNLDRQLRKVGDRNVTDIWLTHGHIGHVDGIGLFGKEVMNEKNVRLHASKSMIELILNTPKWKKLVEDNILIPIQFNSNESIQITEHLVITPIRVPHRDELTDTHAFMINGPEKSLLYLPDHDSWEETLHMVQQNSVIEWFDSLGIEIVFLDGTFWSKNELSRQTDVPHPPVVDSLERLGNLNGKELEVFFIHFNHTNPLLIPNSDEVKQLLDSGCKIPVEGQQFLL
jgi:pyrroloquinoline quinone biosynthesis protein B